MALRAFRSLVRVARDMPASQREEALAAARWELDANRAVADAGEVAKLVGAFESRVGYLRMMTPRRSGAQAGASRVVYGADGTKTAVGTARGKAAHSQFTGGNLDPDAISRHNHTLRRAGFRDNAHAKGFF